MAGEIKLKKLLTKILTLLEQPVGALYITSTNTNPNTTLGYGTWELIDKRFKYQWVTSGFTYDTTNTQNGAFAACLHGNTIELRFNWANKVALSDDTKEIGTLTLSSIGLNTAQHNCYAVGQCDGQNAIGCCWLTLGESTCKLQTVDWVTRATSIPTGTGSDCYVQFTIVAQNASTMIDSFCNEFVWKRTA